MGMVFKDETFRDDYSFSNSPEAIKRFPFPVRQRQLHVRRQYGAAHPRARRKRL